MITFVFSQTSTTQLTLAGADEEVFSVEPKTTSLNSIVQFQVKQPENLDFEKKQQMVLQVRKLKNRP